MLHLMDGFRRSRTATLAVLLAAAAVLGGLGACTSDEPNVVGMGVPAELDLNDPLVVKVRSLVDTGSLTLSDPDLPFDLFEVLYFGVEGEERSSMLARYDFSALRDTLEGRTIGAADIESVTLRLFRMKGYESTADTTDAALTKRFEVWTLADTLDVSAYPGPEPATESLIADEEGLGAAVFIDLPEGHFLDWYENGHTGLMIREGLGSDAGFIGYASADLTTYSQIDLETEGTVVGPTITVTFAEDLEVDPQTFAPTADVSTFHVLEDQPADFADGFMLRTHLRSYPHFRISLDGLPPSIRVNRAVLRCAVDTSLSYGPLSSLVLSEVAVADVADVDTMLLDDFEDVVDAVAGQTNVDPKLSGLSTAPWIGWDVTSTVQRFVNGVVGEEIGILMSDSEDVHAAYDVATWDPEFYLSRFWFHGTAEPASGEEDLRPYLEITYTTFTGGVE